MQLRRGSGEWSQVRKPGVTVPCLQADSPPTLPLTRGSRRWPPPSRISAA
jgi:hypothetical protein